MLSRKAMMAAGAFSPLDDSGLILWLKSDAGLYQDTAKTTPSVNDGDVVGAEEDQSGNGNDVTQATATKKPTLQSETGDLINGLPVVRLDGSDDYLSRSMSINQPFTAYFVVKRDFISANGDYLLDGLTTRVALGHGATGLAKDKTKLFIYAGGSVVADLQENPKSGDIAIYTLVCDGANSTLYLNGVERASGNVGANNLVNFVLFIGTLISFPMKGDQGEIIFSSGAHNQSLRLKYHNYLKRRWGISYVGSGPGGGAVAITLDDGYDTNYNNAFLYNTDVLQTAYIVQDWVGTAGYATLAQLQEMYNAGWDIGNHSKTHTAFDTLTQAQVTSECVSCRDYLIANDMSRAANHLAYPASTPYNLTSRNGVLDAGMLTGRIYDNYGYYYPWLVDNWRISSYQVLSSTTLATVQGWIQTAVANSQNCVLTMHSIKADPTIYDWQTSKYQQLIDWLVANNYTVKTISQLYAEHV